MAEYMVTFIEGMPSVGPSEVEFAEVLDNGWVAVQWRDGRDTLSFYPPHVVLVVRTPTEERSSMLEVEKAVNDAVERATTRIKSVASAAARRAASAARRAAEAMGGEPEPEVDEPMPVEPDEGTGATAR